jgi:hypothetical protein
MSLVSLVSRGFVSRFVGSTLTWFLVLQILVRTKDTLGP